LLAGAGARARCGGKGAEAAEQTVERERPQPMSNQGAMPPTPPDLLVNSPVGQTACNYVSFCRTYHLAAFLLYVLLLVVAIILVWLGHHGTLTLTNAAIGTTVVVAVTIGFMFIHWYGFIKGVIPECASNYGFSGSISVQAASNANVSAATAQASAAQANALAAQAAAADAAAAAAAASAASATPAGPNAGPPATSGAAITASTGGRTIRYGGAGGLKWF
jgi:hypothetical protein